MSKRIARLLAQPEHQVTKLITKLEDKNGYPSHDVRFLAETVQKIRSKMTDLGLDPDDTTAEELYHALLVKFSHDSRVFEEYIGAENNDFDQKSAKARELLDQYAKETRQWGLKKKAAKDVLRQLPPKRLMKHLNYRSIESMLKREDLNEIYLASRYLESGNWLKSHQQLVARLDQTNFEIRNVALMNLSADRWNDIAGPSALVAHNEEVAAVGVWPSERTEKAPLLSIVLLLADTLGSQMDLKVPETAVNPNGIVAWWADMDHLIAELSGQPVSLNLKDTALNHLHHKEFEDRQLDHGRAAFWRELVSRYQKLLDIDGPFDESVKQKIAGLKASTPQPAYEFAEDF